jgi:aminoglycoside N3'-acetyltransferase
MDDLLAGTYCHRCEKKADCFPVVSRDEFNRTTIRVLCETCRDVIVDMQEISEKLENFQRWYRQLRRKNQPRSEKVGSAHAYLYDVLKLISTTYAPEPIKASIQELLLLDDLI